MRDQVLSYLALLSSPWYILNFTLSVINQPQPFIQQQVVIQTNGQPQGQVFGPDFRYGFCDYCADQGQCLMNCCFGPGISSCQIAQAIDLECPCMWLCGVCWLGPLCLTLLRWVFKLMLRFSLTDIGKNLIWLALLSARKRINFKLFFRGQFRQHQNIQGNCCEDFWASCFCWICVTVQMAREAQDVKTSAFGK